MQISPEEHSPNTSPLEKPSTTPSLKEREADIERHSNYKENWSLAQLSRLNNPAIRKQLVDLWESNEKFLQTNGIKEPAGLTEAKDPATGKLLWLDENLGIPKYETLYRVTPYTGLTRKEIEGTISEALDREASFTVTDSNAGQSDSLNTPINYTETGAFNKTNVHHPDRRTAVVGLKQDELIPKKNTTQVMSMIEAHEKGHTLRTLHRSEYLDSLFSAAFTFPPGSMYLDTEKPDELIERMAQLKNYFGIKDDEKFTPQHLEHARKHYIEDLGFDNNMSEFFNAITQEKEFAFLKLMNSIGI